MLGSLLVCRLEVRLGLGTSLGQRAIGLRLTRRLALLHHSERVLVRLHRGAELGRRLVPAVGERLLEVGSGSRGASTLVLVHSLSLFATGRRFAVGAVEDLVGLLTGRFDDLGRVGVSLVPGLRRIAVGSTPCLLRSCRRVLSQRVRLGLGLRHEVLGLVTGQRQDLADAGAEVGERRLGLLRLLRGEERGPLLLGGQPLLERGDVGLELCHHDAVGCGL